MPQYSANPFLLFVIVLIIFLKPWRTRDELRNELANSSLCPLCFWSLTFLYYVFLYSLTFFFFLVFDFSITFLVFHQHRFLLFKSLTVISVTFSTSIFLYFLVFDLFFFFFFFSLRSFYFFLFSL